MPWQLKSVLPCDILAFSFLFALAITNEKGGKYYTAPSSATSPILENAIPILLDLGSVCVAGCGNLGRNFIFWYDYFGASLGQLLERVQRSIEKERVAMRATDRNSGKPSDRSLDVNLSPEGKMVILSYRRSENDLESDSVYYITGVLLESITANEPCGLAVCTVRIPLETLRPGLSLLVIQETMEDYFLQNCMGVAFLHTRLYLEFKLKRPEREYSL